MESGRDKQGLGEIFVDSDAFIALAKEDDSNHRKAQSILAQLVSKPIQFLTSNYVFAETITVISQRIGRQQALSFIQTMKSSNSSFSFRWINEDLEKLALDIFIKQNSKNVSFVDCTNMAIIHRDNIDTIFSFDAIYRKNNIRMVENFLG